MIYVALLRGINVGGNNMIKMADLKAVFEHVGMTDVTTFINSGNVIFQTENKNTDALTKTLEKTLSKEFTYTARLLLKTVPEIEKIIQSAPKEWGGASNLRCNIGFLWDSQNLSELVEQIDIKHGVDSLATGPGVIYMTTPKDLLTKSKFNKLVGTKLYKNMTIRTFNTVIKISSIMSEKYNVHK